MNTALLRHNMFSRIPDKIQASVALMRPLNASITFCAIVAAGVIAASPGTVPWWRMIIGGFAGMLLGGAGNVFNDIFDIDIDRINRPTRVLPSGRVTETFASVLCVSLSLSGLLLSWTLGTTVLLLATGAAIVMILYSLFLKQIPLVGNGAVALLTAAAMCYGSLIAGSISSGLIPGFFAFLTNLIREIVKDMEDVDGDTARGVYTFPGRFGLFQAKGLVTVLLLLLLLLSPLPFLSGAYGLGYLYIALVAVDSMLILLTLALWLLPVRRALPGLSAGLKAIMITGIIAFTVGARWVR